MYANCFVLHGDTKNPVLQAASRDKYAEGLAAMKFIISFIYLLLFHCSTCTDHVDLRIQKEYSPDQ